MIQWSFIVYPWYSFILFPTLRSQTNSTNKVNWSEICRMNFKQTLGKHMFFIMNMLLFLCCEWFLGWVDNKWKKPRMGSRVMAHDVVEAKDRGPQGGPRGVPCHKLRCHHQCHWQFEDGSTAELPIFTLRTDPSGLSRITSVSELHALRRRGSPDISRDGLKLFETEGSRFFQAVENWLQQFD